MIYELGQDVVRANYGVRVVDQFIEAGSFYVMDRGYLDFGRLFAPHQAGAFFVTRAKYSGPQFPDSELRG